MKTKWGPNSCRLKLPANENQERMFQAAQAGDLIALESKCGENASPHLLENRATHPIGYADRLENGGRLYN